MRNSCSNRYRNYQLGNVSIQNLTVDNLSTPNGNSGPSVDSVMDNFGDEVLCRLFKKLSCYYCHR